MFGSIRYSLAGTVLSPPSWGGAATTVLNVFGPGFSTAASALVLLLLYTSLSSFAGALYQVLLAVNRPGFTSVVAIGRLVVTIVFTIVLTPTVGIAGPAAALLAGLVFQIVWQVIALSPNLARPLRRAWPPREQIALVLAYGAGFASASELTTLAPSIAALLVVLPVGSTAYVLALWLAAGLTLCDRGRLREAVIKVGSRTAQFRRKSALVDTKG